MQVTLLPGYEDERQMNLGRAEARHIRATASRLVRIPVINAPATKLGAFLAVVFVSGLLSLVVPPTWTTSPSRWLTAFVVLTVVATLLEFVSVPLDKGGSVTVATIAHIATILLVPAPFAALSVGTSVSIEELIRRAPIPKFAFNVGGMVLTASACSFALGVTGNVWTIRESGEAQGMLVLPFVVTGLLYHALNLVLTSTVFAIASGRSVPHVLRTNTRGTVLSDAGAATVGALAALIWTVEPLLAALLAVPGAVVSRSFEHNHRLEVETRSAVRSLAEIIDDRDATTFHHSERVAGYSQAIAKELGLAEEELELIEQAAAVHDLGKIGIPDRILLKPGPLTAAEFATIQLHTEIGPRILSQFNLFREGAAIVRHHHESFDGSGYPDGLAGKAIPYASRVIAVADAFDAMTSDRPYRAALPSALAVERLREGRGQQWDPVVVDAFIRLFEAGAIDHEPESGAAEHVGSPTGDVRPDHRHLHRHRGAADAGSTEALGRQHPGPTRAGRPRRSGHAHSPGDEQASRR